MHRRCRPPNARLHAVLKRKTECSVARATRRWMLRGGRVARATLYLAVLVSTACSRALTGMKVRSVVLVTGTAARAKRVASARDTSGCFRAIAFAQWRWCAVQRLFFGDFLLAQQKKVTRPPGRTPGTTAPSRKDKPEANQTSNRRPAPRHLAPQLQNQQPAGNTDRRLPQAPHALLRFHSFPNAEPLQTLRTPTLESP